MASPPLCHSSRLVNLHAEINLCSKTESSQPIHSNARVGQHERTAGGQPTQNSNFLLDAALVGCRASGTPSLRNTASKLWVNFWSRSRMRKRTGSGRSVSNRPRHNPITSEEFRA